MSDDTQWTAGAVGLWRRSDGLSVRKLDNGNWSIQAGPERGMSWDKCPCCDKPFPSAEVAKRTARFLYPIRDA